MSLFRFDDIPIRRDEVTFLVCQEVAVSRPQEVSVRLKSVSRDDWRVPGVEAGGGAGNCGPRVFEMFIFVFTLGCSPLCPQMMPSNINI